DRVTSERNVILTVALIGLAETWIKDKGEPVPTKASVARNVRTKELDLPIATSLERALAGTRTTRLLDSPAALHPVEARVAVLPEVKAPRVSLRGHRVA